MQIAIRGASGLIGSALTDFLKQEGHHLYSIPRHKLDKEKLEGLDAVINLAGENISAGRWNRAKKERIYDSRIQSTKQLVKALNQLQSPPKLFLSASAIGYYGIHPAGICDESSPAADDFLAHVCADWEKEAGLYQGGRQVCARFGVVFSSDGGALAKMRLAFSLGVGGVLGNGEQKISWITIDDLVAALYQIIVNPSFTGAVNICTPHPVTNRELTHSLGKVLHRPTLVPMPAFLARLFFGQMAEAMLLSSCAATPKALLDHGFSFKHPNLEAALQHLIQRE